jgi:hypothetical protein
VAAHVGESGAPQASLDACSGDVDARIELAAGKVADLDKQIAQLDSAIAEATKRRKATSGINAVESQRKFSGRPMLKLALCASH